MVRRETTERNDDPWLDSKDLDSARDTLDGYTLDGYTFGLPQRPLNPVLRLRGTPNELKYRIGKTKPETSNRNIAPPREEIQPWPVTTASYSSVT